MSSSVKFGGRSPVVADYFTRSLGVCVEDEVSHPDQRVCVEVFASFGMSERQPFSGCYNHNRHCHTLLVRWLTGLLLFNPFLQMDTTNLCSRRHRHLRTQTRCRLMRTSRRRCLQFRTRDPQDSRVMTSCTLLFPLVFLILLPFPLLGARTRLLPSRLPALMRLPCSG